MTGRLIRQGDPPPHSCGPPYGRRLRRELGDVYGGAIWQCDTCAQQWRWERGYEMMHWRRIKTAPAAS